MRLQDRQLAALEEMGRMRMATVRGLARESWFRGIRQAAVRKALEAVIRRGCAGKADLFSTGSPPTPGPRLDSGREKYYYLTEKGAQVLEYAGIMRAPRSGPLRGHEKVRAYAIYSFCRLCEQRRERLLPEELWEAFPQLRRRGESPQYYLADEGDFVRLMAIKVDARRNASRIDQVTSSVRLEVRRRCSEPNRGSTQPWRAWRDFVRTGQFGVTVLTSLEEKATALRRAFEKDPVRHVAVRVFAVPYLMDLVCPPKD
jgi:hypothetical protein